MDRMLRDGRYLVRSNRTLDYYRDLQDLCKRYLGEYRTASGEQAQELAQILGWTVRLMRYYRTEEGRAELGERQRAGLRSGPRGAARQGEGAVRQETRMASEPVAPPRPAPPRFAPPPPRIETKRETVAVTSKPKQGKAQVKTAEGETIPCTNLPSFPPVDTDDQFRADVTREGGKAVRAVFKNW
jgi:hypothetical protein